MRMDSADRSIVLTKPSPSPSPGCSQCLNLLRQRKPDSQGDRPPSRVICVIWPQDQRLFIFLHLSFPDMWCWVKHPPSLPACT